MRRSFHRHRSCRVARLCVVAHVSARVRYKVRTPRAVLLTLRLPSCEKRWPQFGALQTYPVSSSGTFRSRVSYKGLYTSVSTNVNLEMRLLIKALVTARHVTLIPLSWLLAGLDRLALSCISNWTDRIWNIVNSHSWSVETVETLAVLLGWPSLECQHLWRSGHLRLRLVPNVDAQALLQMETCGTLDSTVEAKQWQTLQNTDQQSM